MRCARFDFSVALLVGLTSKFFQHLAQSAIRIFERHAAHCIRGGSGSADDFGDELEGEFGVLLEFGFDALAGDDGALAGL